MTQTLIHLDGGFGVPACGEEWDGVSSDLTDDPFTATCEACVPGLLGRPVVYTYRNKHTGSVVRIIDAPMRFGVLYAHTSPWLDRDDENTTTYRMTWGLEGRDGTTFDPQHWDRVHAHQPDRSARPDEQP